jgi:hypothetical protein
LNGGQNLIVKIKNSTRTKLRKFWDNFPKYLQ